MLRNALSWSWEDWGDYILGRSWNQMAENPIRRSPRLIKPAPIRVEPTLRQGKVPTCVLPIPTFGAWIRVDSMSVTTEP